jgi:hypothetical protein
MIKMWISKTKRMMLKLTFQYIIQRKIATSIKHKLVRNSKMTAKLILKM